MQNVLDKINEEIRMHKNAIKRLKALRLLVKDRAGDGDGPQMFEVEMNVNNFATLKQQYRKAVDEHSEYVEFEGNNLPIEVAKGLIEKIEEQLISTDMGGGGHA